MTSTDSPDPLVTEVSRLAALRPDPERARHVRMRCQAGLARNRRRSARAATISRSLWRVLAPAIVGGFCILYVIGLVATTLRVEGLI
jgi:hypothetical protein